MPVAKKTADATDGYELYELREAVEKKEMYAGALHRTEADRRGAFVVESDAMSVSECSDGASDLGSEGGAPAPGIEFRPLRLPHTPAVLTALKEILTNASDKAMGDLVHKVPAARRTTAIDVTFDPRSGRYEVFNDGSGVPVTVHAKATALAGRPVRIPELAFGMFLGGTNMSKAPDSTKGGVNGFGAKISAVHSADVGGAAPPLAAPRACPAGDPPRGLFLETVGRETLADGAEGPPHLYRQYFRDRLRAIEPPLCVSLLSKEGRAFPAEVRKAHTRVAFTPRFADLGYEMEATGDPARPWALPAEVGEELEAWLRGQVILIAAYLGKKVAVTFNGAPCPPLGADGLAAVELAEDPAAFVLPLTLKPVKGAEVTAPSGDVRLPIQVAVGVSPRIRKFAHTSIINGVPTAAGSHLRFVKKLIADAVTEKQQKLTKGTEKVGAADAARHLFVSFVGPLPGAAWGGQSKDELQVAPKLLSCYAPSAADLSRVAEAALQVYLQAQAGPARSRRKVRVGAAKYSRARLAGGAKSAECTLLVTEGDSAQAFVDQGIGLGEKANPGGPTATHFGSTTLGGVIPNAMKKTTTIATPGGGAVVIRNQKLTDNKKIQEVVDILGLDYGCTYEDPAEMKGLRYGRLIVCTDQDLDGTGKILPLVLVLFHVFWPALLQRGYVARLVTPVIRAYAKQAGGRKGIWKKHRDALRAASKGKGKGKGAGAAPALPTLPAGVREFLYENDFRAWAETQGGLEAVAAAHDVKYYKGLATHNDPEVESVFRQFDSLVQVFTVDDSTRELFNVYYGPASALRKKALVNPVEFLTHEQAERIHAERRIPCSTLLRVDSHAYKLDDLSRKLPGVFDGIPVARRKALAGALTFFANRAGEVKVFQLGGYVAEKMSYHHGDASLNNTLVGMAQRYPGALNYPYLVGEGQFGTRHKNGADAGSPRYIEVRLAAPFARAMLPRADTWLLPHVFEDGERAEPRFFVPVLPGGLLDSSSLPSEGWTHASYSRDYGDILRLTRAVIAGDPDVAAVLDAVRRATRRPGPLGAWLQGDDAATAAAERVRARFPLRTSLRGYGDHLGLDEEQRRADLLRDVGGRETSFGFYEVDAPPAPGGAAVVRIRELPLRVPTVSYLKTLAQAKRAALITEVDLSEKTKERAAINIHLAPGAYEKILGTKAPANTDPIEEFFLLRKALHAHLNFYSDRGTVLEFGDDYHAVFFYWAAARADLYRRRLERERVVLALRRAVIAETVRYVESGYAARRAADDEAAAAELAALGFARFYARAVDRPDFTPTADLEDLATGERATYDYALDLRDRDKTLKAQEKRKEKLAALAAEAARVEAALAERPIPGGSIWAAEVDAVDAAIARGEETDWNF